MPLDVDAITAEGQWRRHVPAGTDPTKRPDPLPDGRWQLGRIVDALYLADSEDCAWAEWYRSLAEAALPPHVALPRDLWIYEVAPPLEVADLSDLGRLARVGLGPPRPGRQSWSAFQAVGEQLRREGWRGLVAPSAARPASMVLVVFMPERTLPTELIPVGSTRVAEPPAPPRGMRT